MRSTTVFLATERERLIYLLTSIYSLRRWWAGEIMVYCWPEVTGTVEIMAKDKRLSFQFTRVEPLHREENAYDIGRQQVANCIDREVGLFLSDNILVRGDLEPLINKAKKGFVATTSGKSSEIDSSIFAYLPGSKVLEEWSKLTLACSDHLEAGNKTLNEIYSDLQRTFKNDLAVAGNQWNGNIREQEEALIWCFRNEENVRPDLSSKAVKIWKPTWENCQAFNIGFVNEWKDQVMISNPYLVKFVND